MPSVCSACVWRWSSALCASLASFWRVHSCVELRAQFCACTKIPTHTTNDDECIALVQRARRTSSAWRRTPSERRRTDHSCYFFSARAMRPACVTGALGRNEFVNAKTNEFNSAAIFVLWHPSAMLCGVQINVAGIQQR